MGLMDRIRRIQASLQANGGSTPSYGPEWGPYMSGAGTPPFVAGPNPPTAFEQLRRMLASRPLSTTNPEYQTLPNRELGPPQITALPNRSPQEPFETTLLAQNQAPQPSPYPSVERLLGLQPRSPEEKVQRFRAMLPTMQPDVSGPTLFDNPNNVGVPGTTFSVDVPGRSMGNETIASPPVPPTQPWNEAAQVDRARQYGEGSVPAPTQIGDVMFPNTFTGHPRLRQLLENAAITAAALDPDSPYANVMLYRMGQAQANAALPGQRLESGLKTVGTLDAMRRAQTAEDQNAQLFPSVLRQARGEAAGAGQYTLTPGSARFSPQGQPIAQVPASAGDLSFEEAQFADRKAQAEQKLGRPLFPQESADLRATIRTEIAAQGTGQSDVDRYAELAVKAGQGTATPEELAEMKAREQYHTAVTQMSFGLGNPPADADTVSWIADQLLQPGGEKYRTELLGSNRTLQEQVRSELARRGEPLEQLTTTNRQMGETARVLIPKFQGVIRELNDPKWQQKMGPIAGRWNEFLAGRVGTGDPDYAKLRETIGLLKTGTLRAHMGARGGQGMLGYFDTLLNSNRMDIPTLKASLEGISDFLQGYADMLERPTGAGTESPAATHRYNPATGQIEAIQ